MKKEIATIVAGFVLIAVIIGIGVYFISPALTGNKTYIDTVYNYNYAYIKLPNGEVIEGNVENWTDYEGEQLQITIDGIVYLCHSANATLISR